MYIIQELIISSIFLLFPLSVYLIYITYIRNMDLKENSILLDLALTTSLLILIRFTRDTSFYITVLFNVPLLISYIKNRRLTASILSVILIFYYQKHLGINLVLLFVEYIIYALFYLFLDKRRKQHNFIDIFIPIKSFFSAITVFTIISPELSVVENIYSLFLIIILFIAYTYLIVYLFKKTEDIMNFNIIIKEAKKEQKLYNSLSKLTHELKNPITVCKGYIEIMDKKGLSKNNKFIPIIEDEINRALNVINDFSYLGKLKDLNLEEVDLILVLEEITNMLSPLFKKNKNELKLILPEEDIYMELDYSKIKQVFVNIIKNALEAATPNKKLIVSITAKSFLKYVKIIIKDNGIGMSKETLEKINEIFFTTKENGNGLGVVLSKEIVEMHKGSISYSSSLNKGTTVTIKLPIN